MRYILYLLLLASSLEGMPKNHSHKHHKPKKKHHKPENYHRKVVRTCTYEEDVRSGEETPEVAPKKKKHRKAKKILGLIFTLGLSALFGPCK